VKWTAAEWQIPIDWSCRAHETVIRTGSCPSLREAPWALNFKADDPVEAALQGAFLAAISLKFDHRLSFKPKLRA
jgi:hypothetical protein